MFYWKGNITLKARSGPRERERERGGGGGGGWGLIFLKILCLKLWYLLNLCIDLCYVQILIKQNDNQIYFDPRHGCGIIINNEFWEKIKDGNRNVEEGDANKINIFTWSLFAFQLPFLYIFNLRLTLYWYNDNQKYFKQGDGPMFIHNHFL